MNNIIIKPLLGVEFNNKLLSFGISKNELINFFKKKPDLDKGNHIRYLEYGAFDFNDDVLSNIEIYIDNIGNTNIVSLDDLNFNLNFDEVLTWFLNKGFKFRKDDPELGYSYIFNELELTLWRPCRPEDIEEDLGENDYQKGIIFSTVGIGIKGTWSNSKF